LGGTRFRGQIAGVYYFAGASARSGGKYQVRGCGAAGSAPHWQCGGQGFESPQLHPIEQHKRLDSIDESRGFLVVAAPWRHGGVPTANRPRAGRVARLEATSALPWRASLVAGIGQLGGQPHAWLNDDHLGVWACAALVPALVTDPVALSCWWHCLARREPSTRRSAKTCLRTLDPTLRGR
jgi:hypothetical protein